MLAKHTNHRKVGQYSVAVFMAILSFSACSAPSNSLISKSAPNATNIIFLIGDGMGLSQITAGMYSSGNKSALERFPVVGLIKTQNSKNLITDSAAGATAFSSGKKTYNGAIAVDTNQQPTTTIMEDANQREMQTGFIVTCTITHATPAAFYAHDNSREHYQAIAEDFASANVDLAIGYGQEQFNQREDNQDLIAKLKSRGYEYYDNPEDIDGVSDKPLAVIMPGEPPKVDGRPASYLKNALDYSLERFAANKEPFFLMVEGSQIDWGGHDNDADYLIGEWKDFDKAVARAMDFAEKDGHTLVVVTADHETGGFAINGGKLMADSLQTAFTTLHHTATMVPLFAYGPGSELFSGIQDNTDVYYNMRKAMGWK